jgi:DMSO/TMAO reductase YedYZ molybdopterin-dependent catalytic subunit
MNKTQVSPALPPVTDTHPRYPLWLRILVAALFAPIAGLVASLAATVMMGILRLAAGIPTPVELFGDFVLKHIDVNTFIHLLERFAPHPKTTPLGLALLGMIAMGTALGWLYALLVQPQLPAWGYRPGRREWVIAGVFSIAMTVIATVLFWDELRQNFLGLPVDWSRLATMLGLLLTFATYGFVLCLSYRALLPKALSERVTKHAQQRRQLLSSVGVVALGIGTGAGTFGLIKNYLSRYAAYDGMSTPTHNGFTAPITPNSEHYVVTQNPIDPTPNIELWRLEVTGLVNHPGSYTYTELQQLPSVSRAVTLECIANQIDGHLMSTAIWQGVTLRSLLERHGGALSNASYVAFYSVDGYNISLPLDEVLAEDALLAWSMNGVALPERHGFPLRALIPGRYGEENPKWLTRVELTDHFVSGLYSDQGWYHGTLHTISRFDRPAPDSQLPLGHTVDVGGVAFAGNRGIEKVEISVDGSLTWRTATLQPALSPDSWVLWTWQWTPMLPGTYTLVVRATDGTGQLQISTKQGTVPNGATGYHTIMVVVA